MKMVNNLRNFLEDKNYYIDIFDDKIHAFNYIKLLRLSNLQINIKFEKFILEIKGDNLKIKQMNNTEILVSGTIENLGFIQND